MTEPEAPEETPPDVPRRTLFRFMGRLVLRHPWLLAAAILASVGMALANLLSIALVFPFLETLGGGVAVPDAVPLAFITDLFDGMDTASTIRVIAGLLVAVQLLRGALSFAESRVSAYLKILIERDLRETIFDELLRIEYRYIQSERTANLQTLLHSYPRQSADIVDQYLSALKKTFTGATYFLAMLAVSVPLTLLALALGALSLLAVQGINRAVRRNAAVTNELRVRLQQTSLESLQGMKLIRLFAREDAARTKYQTHLREMRRQSFRGGSLSALIPPLQGLVTTVLIAALIVAATFVLPAQLGDSWVLVLALFLVIMARLAQPLQAFSKRRAKITAEIPALEEVVRFLEAEKPRLVEGTRRFEGLRQGVTFEEVSYAYPGGAGPALAGVHLTIPRGRTTAIVGPSGSGKSTLLALLARLSDPSSGRVLVDGVDLRAFDSSTWRRRLAFVSQDSHLFRDTVRNNIRFARPEATDAEVEAAARRAQAHEFILAMEQGYDTLVGERGARLSGGQAQRIAIARALLAQPDILVLDEATSALDTGTEREVQSAIEAASEGRTVVVVAHRLSTVRAADVIHVLDGGRIVESGTHDELVGRQGAYHRFVTLQDAPAGQTPLPLTPRPVAPLPAPAVAPVPLVAPLRAVLTSPVRTARLVNGREVADEVPVRVEGVHGDRETLLREPGDRLVIQVGGLAGTARVRGVLHEGVPLFMRTADGREVPVRPALKPATT